MNKAILQRTYSGNVTIGKLTLWFDHPDIFTLELPWNDNKDNISCIPQGIYNVTGNNTVDHPNTFRLLSVPDRFGILIHPGNYASRVELPDEVKEPETKGCIMVGFGIDKKVPMLLKSVKAMEFLRDNIKANFCLEVKNK